MLPNFRHFSSFSASNQAATNKKLRVLTAFFSLSSASFLSSKAETLLFVGVSRAHPDSGGTLVSDPLKTVRLTWNNPGSRLPVTAAWSCSACTHSITVTALRLSRIRLIHWWYEVRRWEKYGKQTVYWQINQPKQRGVIFIIKQAEAAMFCHRNTKSCCVRAPSVLKETVL